MRRNSWFIDLQLILHYQCTKFIPDFKRRLRVMSHSLRVETGRWSRIPPEMRLCTCDQHAVQTEEHVLLACPLSRTLRQRYGSLDFTNMTTLMESKGNEKELCNFTFDVLYLYS